MADETQEKVAVPAVEPGVDAQRAAENIVAQADEHGAPRLTMVGGPAAAPEPIPEPAAPEEPVKALVPVQEAAAFIVTCNKPGKIADGCSVCHRSLVQALDQVLGRLSKECGEKAITDIKDLDAKFEGVELGLQYNLPADMKPPEKGTAAVEVFRRTIVAPTRLSEAITGIMRLVIPVERMMDAVVQLLVGRASVSGMHMCAVTMIDKDGKVGGTVINNPSMPNSATQATILYDTMKNHAEEFKRSCEKQGLQIGSLIIPSGDQVAKLSKPNALPRGQRHRQGR